MMLRILIVTPNYLPVVGGAELAVHRLAQALLAQGHRPAVLCPDLGPLPEGLPYPVWRYRVPRRGGALAHRFVLAIRACLAAFTHRADVVHAHYADPAGWAALATRWIHRRPVFVTSHGADLQRVPEIGYGFRLDRRADGRVRWVMAGADGLVAISAEIASEMLSAGAVPGRIARIPNGVDVEGVGKLSAPSGRRHDGPMILAVGRNHPKKAFDVLIRAFGRLAGVHPSARLVIAGEGTTWLRPVVRDEGLDGRVELLGRIPPKGEAFDVRDPLPPALAALYGQADIFCSPSTVEAFPLVNVEAMAAGLPLVLTDISGNREVVEDHVNGRLVPPGDPDALAAVLSDCLSNPRRLEEFGRASADRAHGYGWERVAAHHVDFFRKIGERGSLRIIPLPEESVALSVESQA